MRPSIYIQLWPPLSRQFPIAALTNTRSIRPKSYSQRSCRAMTNQSLDAAQLRSMELLGDKVILSLSRDGNQLIGFGGDNGHVWVKRVNNNKIAGMGISFIDLRSSVLLYRNFGLRLQYAERSQRSVTRPCTEQKPVIGKRCYNTDEYYSIYKAKEHQHQNTILSSISYSCVYVMTYLRLSLTSISDVLDSEMNE